MPKPLERIYKEKVDRQLVKKIKEMVHAVPGILDENVEGYLTDQGVKLTDICTAVDFLRGNLRGSQRAQKTHPQLVVQTDRSAELKRIVGRRYYLMEDLPKGTELVETMHNAAAAEGADDLIRNTLNPKHREEVLASRVEISSPMTKTDYYFLEQALLSFKKKPH